MWPIAVWPRRPRSFCSSKTWRDEAEVAQRGEPAAGRRPRSPPTPGRGAGARRGRSRRAGPRPGRSRGCRRRRTSGARPPSARGAAGRGSGRRRRRRSGAGPSSRAARRRPAGQAITAQPPPSPKSESGPSGSSSSAPIPRVERGLGEADREPAVGDVVRERQQRGGLPEEADQRRLGRQVELRGLAAELAVQRLVLRAGERELGLAGEEDDVALPPARPGRRARRGRGRRSRRPGWGGSSGRRCRCRARRCPRRRGSRAPRPPRAIPSIASASSHAISGFSGLPKLRQSVRASGSPPAQATFRAASSTASAPPVRGSSDASRPWPSSETASPRSDGRRRSTAASSPGLRTVREPTRWS